METFLFTFMLNAENGNVLSKIMTARLLFDLYSVILKVSRHLSAGENPHREIILLPPHLRG